MTYDLFLWRRKARSKLTRGAAYLFVAENLPCTGLAKIDAERIASEVTAAAGGADRLELDFDERHVHVGMSPSRVESLLHALAALAARERLELFDPQVEAPSDADRLIFEKARAELDLAGRDEELETWQRRAEAGDPLSMTALGDCYAFGDRVSQSFEIAADWYRRAWAKGHLAALVNLAECYRLGQGVSRDPVEAIKLYLLAYEHEQCVSGYALGVMFANGEGVEKDIVKAEAYLRAARASRHPEAFLMLQKLGLEPLR